MTVPVGTETVQNIYVKGYSGNMGTQANPLTVNADRLSYAGTGAEAHFTSTLDTLICKHTSRDSLAFNITPTMATTSDEFFIHFSGRVNVLGGDLPAVITWPLTSGSGPVLNVDSSVTMGQEIIHNVGEIQLDSPPSTAMIINGGRMTISNGGTVGALRMAGGFLEFTGNTALTINEADISGGILNASALQAAITLSGRLQVGTRAQVNLDNGQAISGGTIIVAPGGRYTDHNNSGAAEFF